MSYKFEVEGRKYWAKELANRVEVYQLNPKDINMGLAEKVAELEAKATQEEVIFSIKDVVSE